MRIPPSAPKALFLAGLAFLLYLPSLGGSFLAWDDRSLVLDNPVARLPPGEAVLAAFSGPPGASCWPLRDISYALDHAIWGFAPLGFHLTNLLLYAAVAAGLYAAARRNLGGGGAFLGTLLFVLHPLHAEPVAWISGRKDLLCAAWLMLAWWVLALAPGGRAHDPGKGRRFLRYAIGLTAYVAACLSKTAALPFPLVWWLQDRLFPKPGARWGWLERLPFFLAMGCLAAGQAASSLASGAAGNYLADAAGLKQALVTPVKSLIDQGGALILPWGLSPAYPPGQGPWTFLRWAGWILALTGAVLLALALRRARGQVPGELLRKVLFGVAWTLLFLLPVINLGLATSTARADRYAFLPSVGFCLGSGALLAAAWDRLRLRAVGMLLLWAILAWVQGGRWRDDVSLWRQPLRLDPGSLHAASGLGWGYSVAGYPESARRAMDRLVRLDPGAPVSHHQLGALVGSQGDLPRALLEYGEALQRYSEKEKGRTGIRVPSGYRRERILCLLEMGGLVMGLGRPLDAARYAEQAVALDGSEARSWAFLGLFRGAAGDLPAAAAACERAIALDPALPEGHWHRARVAQQEGEAALASGDLGRAREAFSRVALECRRLQRLDQGSNEVLARLGFAEIRLSQLTEDTEARQAHRTAAFRALDRIPPSSRSPADLRNLASLLRLKAEDLAQQGDLPHAYQAVNAASGLQPEDPALHRLAAAYARAMGQEALALPHDLRSAAP
jgi:tetratricopeptide (TPR) repeat protein